MALGGEVPVNNLIGARKGIYAIRDKTAGATIGNLITERHAGVACRIFGSLLADKTTVMHQYPKEFELICCGYIDEEGQIDSMIPSVVMTGESWLVMNSTSEERANA